MILLPAFKSFVFFAVYMMKILILLLTFTALAIAKDKPLKIGDKERKMIIYDPVTITNQNIVL